MITRNSQQRFTVSFPKWFRFPQLLGLLIVFQLVALLAFWLTWPVTLSFATPYEEIEYWAPLIQNFEKQNPRIHIELLDDPGITYTTDDVEVIYTADLQNGVPQYDLVYMDIIWVPWFADRGWLKDLSEFISESDLSEFLPREVEAGRYQNGLYRIPFRSDIGVLFYNKSLLEAGGYQLPKELPESWETLAEVSKDLQRQKIAKWGYLWQGQEYEGLVATFVEVLDGYDGFWIKPDIDKAEKKVGLDEAAAFEAVEFMRSMITPNTITAQVESSPTGEILDQEISPSHVLSSGEQESFETFESGETAFLRGWSYFWKRANQAGAPLRGNFGVVPGYRYQGQSCRGGWGFGIANNTNHPKEAWQAIQYLTSASAQRQFVLDSGYLPSRKALFEDPEILKQYPHFFELRQTLKNNSIFRPQLPEYDEASGILQKHLWEALVGMREPEEAMKEAALETRQLLARGAPTQG